jgi:hypothetical protein
MWRRPQRRLGDHAQDPPPVATRADHIRGQLIEFRTRIGRIPTARPTRRIEVSVSGALTAATDDGQGSTQADQGDRPHDHPSRVGAGRGKACGRRSSSICTGRHDLDADREDKRCPRRVHALNLHRVIASREPVRQLDIRGERTVTQHVEPTEIDRAGEDADAPVRPGSEAGATDPDREGGVEAEARTGGDTAPTAEPEGRRAGTDPGRSRVALVDDEIHEMTPDEAHAVSTGEFATDRTGRNRGGCRARKGRRR